MALNSNMLVFAFTIFSLFGSLLSFPPNVMVATYGTPNVTVATDGGGNFGTISEAISQIPVNRNDPYVVLIKAGTYNEAISIGQNKSNLVLIGEGMDKTIIQFNKSAKTAGSTSDSAAVGNACLIHLTIFSYCFFTHIFIFIYNLINFYNHTIDHNFCSNLLKWLIVNGRQLLSHDDLTTHNRLHKSYSTNV